MIDNYSSDKTTIISNGFNWLFNLDNVQLTLINVTLANGYRFNNVAIYK